MISFFFSSSIPSLHSFTCSRPSSSFSLSSSVYFPLVTSFLFVSCVPSFPSSFFPSRLHHFSQLYMFSFIFLILVVIFRSFPLVTFHLRFMFSSFFSFFLFSLTSSFATNNSLVFYFLSLLYFVYLSVSSFSFFSHPL